MAARKQENTYNRALRAALEPVALRVSVNRVQRLLGFWVLVHTYGGVHQVRVIYSEPTWWRLRKEFRDAFGVEVEDWAPEAAALLRPVTS